MKSLIWLCIICISFFTSAMQKNEKVAQKTKEKLQQETEIDVMLKKLADEKSNLGFKDFQEALRILNELELQKNDKILVTKALWGIARACHDSYAPDSLALAEVLMSAGANPTMKIKVDDIVRLSSKDGKGFSYTAMDYETTVMEMCSGNLKKYLEDKQRN